MPRGDSHSWTKLLVLEIKSSHVTLDILWQRIEIALLELCSLSAELPQIGNYSRVDWSARDPCKQTYFKDHEGSCPSQVQE